MTACLVTLMGICLFDPSGVYVTGETYVPSQYRSNEGGWCGHQKRFCRGPIGELKVGLQVQATSTIAIDYGFKHTSFIMENDGGNNGFFASLTWKPWRQ